MSANQDQHPRTGESRMKLLYGLNEADSWWHFAVGPQRERIRARLQELEVRVIRIFVYDKSAPDPVSDWKTFAAYVQAVLDVGAVPMITFAKSPRPLGDSRAARWYANRCGDLVWSAIEHWGPEAVRNWFWCVWNEPNSTWIGGGMTFEQYRRVYEAVAEQVLRWLAPHLDGNRPRIGGPSVEGFQPFWLDWIWQFVNEVDPSLIGFVNWHLYADWRDHGEQGAPTDEAVHRALMLWQTPEYAARAAAVAETLNGLDILNICGERNAHSHYLPRVHQLVPFVDSGSILVATATPYPSIAMGPLPRCRTTPSPVLPSILSTVLQLDRAASETEYVAGSFVKCAISALIRPPSPRATTTSNPAG